MRFSPQFNIVNVFSSLHNWHASCYLSTSDSSIPTRLPLNSLQLDMNKDESMLRKQLLHFQAAKAKGKLLIVSEVLLRARKHSKATIFVRKILFFCDRPSIRSFKLKESPANIKVPWFFITRRLFFYLFLNSQLIRFWQVSIPTQHLFVENSSRRPWRNCKCIEIVTSLHAG